MSLRKLLNTLYITSPEAYLGRDGENVVVRIDDEVKFRIPIHNLESIVTFGYVGASPDLMYLCTERGVSLAFLSPSGRLKAKMATPTKGNVLLRRRQYRLADEVDETLELARNFVFGKLHNCRAVLRRYLRDYPNSEANIAVGQTAKELTLKLERVLGAGNIDELRGIEGEGSRSYYEVFDHLILEAKDVFFFHGRSRRPPLDRTNALLSFLYSMLAHDCSAALETVGLDPQVGYLHSIRPGRDSLALDLMEELRPYLVDRLALSLINTRQISLKDFEVKESRAVLLNEDGRKKVIQAWQSRKQEQIIHPYLQEKIEIGLVPYAQSLLLARCIRGDLDAYPPFLWK